MQLNLIDISEEDYDLFTDAEIVKLLRDGVIREPLANRDYFIHFAIKHGRNDLLIEITNDPKTLTYQNSAGQTPLELAISLHNGPAVKILSTTKLEKKFSDEWKEKVYFPKMMEYYEIVLAKINHPLADPIRIWQAFSANVNVTLDTITNNPQLPWQWRGDPLILHGMVNVPFSNGISQNPNLTINFIKANRNKGWDWQCVSFNPAITLQMIEDNPDLPWDKDAFLANPNCSVEKLQVTFEKLMKEVDRTTDRFYYIIDYMIRNPNLTIPALNSCVRAALLDWNAFIYNFPSALQNPGFNIDVINALTKNENVLKPEYYGFLIRNPNLTLSQALSNDKLKKHISDRDWPDITPKLLETDSEAFSARSYANLFANPDVSIELALKLNKLTESDFWMERSQDVEEVGNENENEDEDTATSQAWDLLIGKLSQCICALSENPNLNLNLLMEHPLAFWEAAQNLYANTLETNRQSYIENKIAQLNLISMYDEDQSRAADHFYDDNSVLFFFSNEYLIDQALKALRTPGGTVPADLRQNLLARRPAI